MRASASAIIRSISSAHDGRSSIRPATWPDDISPRSGRPSTIAARNSIGVFAAISTCPHDSELPRRIERPARHRSSADRPATERKRIALRTDRASVPTGPPRSRRSTSGVRSTRCGTPSTRRVTTVPSRPAARYTFLTASATGLSLVSRNRVPIAIPAAP
jgi:hypothetical protein